MTEHRHHPSWAADVVRPVPLLAAAVLALNDHVLKGAGVVPAAVTGKLSDVVGLLVAGIVAVAIARGVARALTGALPRRAGGLGVTALIIVGLGFAALKLWPGFNRVVAGVWGVNVLDASDLWALVMLAVAWLWLRDRDERELRDDGVRARPSRFIRGLALIGVLLVCAATPRAPPVPPPPVPGWSVDDLPLAVACGEVSAWVSKSGKTGAGLTIEAIATDVTGACDVTIVAATMRFSDAAFVGREVDIGPAATAVGDRGDRDDRDGDRPRHLSAATGAVVRHYVGFEFDNQARWNRGQRAATFELALDVAGARQTWTLPATHVYATFPAGYR